MHRSGKNFGTIGESSVWAKKVTSPKPDGQSRVVEWGSMDGWRTDQTSQSNKQLLLEHSRCPQKQWKQEV